MVSAGANSTARIVDGSLRTSDCRSATSGHVDSSQALYPGQEFDRYRILGLVGKGGMGEVYAAYDPELGRKIAIKLLSTRAGLTPNKASSRVVSLASHPQASPAMLLAEARALARLVHEAIVPVFDVGEAEGRVYLAMEFIDGATLTDWAELKFMDTWARTALMLQVGEGLAAAHRADMVHRDIKPDNIMVCSEGRSYILDFGLACFARSAEGDDETAHPITGGTRGYMPPEQFIEGVVDARSDQYAFCVTLYELLAGRKPRPGLHTQSATTLNAVQDDATLQWCAEIPRVLRPILARGLSLDPADRYPSMAALLSELGARVQSHRKRWRSRAWWAVSTVAVSMVMAGWLSGADSPCEQADGDARRIWNPDIAQSIRAELVDSQLQGAGYAAAELLPALDSWFAHWSDQAQSNCRLLASDQGVGIRALDLRRQCLDAAMSRARSVVRALRIPSEELIDQGPKIVATLPELERCLDDVVLADESSSSPAAHERESVARVLSHVERVRTASIRGDIPLGLALCDAGRRLADALEHDATVIEFDGVCAEIHIDAQRLTAAAKLLRRAYLRAVAAGVDRLAAELGAQLAFLEGYAMQQARATIDGLMPRVDAQLNRAGMEDSEAAYNLHNSHAASLVVADDFEQAAERFEWLEGFASRNFGADHPYSIISRSNHGYALVLGGKGLERARFALTSSLESYFNLGEVYSRRALEVRGNLLVLATETGDLALADSSMPDSFFEGVSEGMRMPPLARVIDKAVEQLWSMRRLEALSRFRSQTLEKLADRVASDAEQQGNSWLWSKRIVLDVLVGESKDGSDELFDDLWQPRDGQLGVWEMGRIVIPQYCAGKTDEVANLLTTTRPSAPEANVEDRKESLETLARTFLLAVVIGDDGLALQTELEFHELWRSYRTEEREGLVGMVEFNLLMAGAYLRKRQPASAHEWLARAQQALPMIDGRILGLQWHIEWMAARLESSEAERTRALQALDERWRAKAVDPILHRTIAALRGHPAPPNSEPVSPCVLYWP